MADLAHLNILFSILGGALPALVWLLFWLREDRKNPEPKVVVMAVFLGGAFAVLPAYLVQEGLRHLWSLDLNTTLIPTVIAWAGTEEIIKYLIVAALALSSRWFDEPIDAMIYMITVALGFAAAENSLFMLKVLNEGGSNIHFWLNGNFRFIGSTIVHIVSCAVLGIAIALSYCSTPIKRYLSLGAGLLGATLLHSLFNYFIIKSADTNILKIFILFWALSIVIIYLFERVKLLTCRIIPN
jgi:RsiW-degrading membrane proteinase PrsW (M82 family)